MLTQYKPQGRNASEISRDVEAALRDGRLAPGAALPPVRGLAAELGLSPVTVAAAYRELREKGIARGNGRAGTRITGAPPIGPRPALTVPDGVRNLLVGSPDPELLPALPAVTPRPRLYGDPPVTPRLGRLAAEQFRADGIDPAHLAVVGGALDGVERVFGAWLRPGDRVGVEDPGYPPVLDLLAAMGLTAVGMPIDDYGVRPAALQDALARGCQAVLFTPRAQAPTGAAWDQARAAELREVLAGQPEVGVIEDDHAGPVAGAAAHTIAGGGRQRWATIRSVSKSLGPDLRLATLAGDAVTVSRVEGRQALGTGMGEPPAAGDRGRAVGRPVDGQAVRAGRRPVRRAPRRPDRRARRPGRGRPGRSGPRGLGAGGRRARGHDRAAAAGLGRGTRRALPDLRTARHQDWNRNANLAGSIDPGRRHCRCPGPSPEA